MDKISLGSFGEEMAVNFLKRKGYSILEKNFKCRIGEIDVIAEKENRIHFIEVKTRTNHIFGTPAESVGKKKMEKIRKVAAVYLLCNKKQNYQVQFDVVEFTWNHIKQAF